MQNEQGLNSSSKGFPSILEKLSYPLCLHGLNNKVLVACLGDARERQGLPEIVRRKIFVHHTKNTLLCILQKYLKFIESSC